MLRMFRTFALPVIGLGLAACDSAGLTGVSKADCFKPLPRLVLTPGVSPELEKRLIDNPNLIYAFYTHYHKSAFVDGLPLSSIELHLNYERTRHWIRALGINLQYDLDDSFSIEPEEIERFKLHTGSLGSGRKFTYDISPADADEDGALSRKEILKFARSQMEILESNDDFLIFQAMASFDANGNNILAWDELKYAFYELADRLDIEDVKFPPPKFSPYIPKIPEDFDVAYFNIEAEEKPPCLSLQSTLDPLSSLSLQTELPEYYRARLAGEFSSSGQNGKVFDEAYYARGELLRVYRAYVNNAYNEGLPIQEIEHDNNVRSLNERRAALSEILLMDVNADLKVTAPEILAYKTYLPRQFENSNLKYGFEGQNGELKGLSEADIFEKAREFGNPYRLPSRFNEPLEVDPNPHILPEKFRKINHRAKITKPYLNYLGGFEANGDDLITLDEVNVGLSKFIGKYGLEQELGDVIQTYSSPKYVRGTHRPMPERYRKALRLDQKTPQK